MRYLSASGFVLDDVFITELYPRVFHPDKDTDRLQITWTINIKPLAVDEILWKAFLPDVKMGPQMRINRRVNGAFTVRPLRIDTGSMQITAASEPDWEPVLDHFDRVRADFIATYPTAADYVTALSERAHGIASGQDLTRSVTALIAAGRSADAARVADEAIADGQSGGMSSTVDVLKYLAAYAKGPQAYSAFQTTLIPTHDYKVLDESRSSSSIGLCREHHPSSMRRMLAEMDGTDAWGIVVSVRPPSGQPEDFSNLRYLQAAGSAEAMVIELCQSGGAEMGAVSVRSVVGHPHGGAAEQNVEIVLPHGVETIAPHEVFEAAEAADMFESFYRADTIGEGYVLRAVEGYTSGGGHVRP
ncbi:hypothetical protein BKG76_00195 [Mycobacteroides franklinii]|uniref:Uncharacterized protein n=2 Tax=Mycobacteroides franklinii TaxID=948102 RepID=A0A1S1LGQ4_9MYCO|nr:hypothetical protein BKG76_00195 [Mycobacteroides franklinii]